MSSWVRLWHDMPTDPKWRVIARRSGRSVSEVIAIFNFVMVNASANANERGRTHNLFADDIAAALDLEEPEVQAVLDAMQGKVMDGNALTGWETRQPKREDDSASRAKKWREDKKAERNRTQPNAEERPETETDAEYSVPNGTAAMSDPEKMLFDTGIAFLTANGSTEAKARTMLGKWKQKHGPPETIVALSAAMRAGATDPVSYIAACLNNRRQNHDERPSIAADRAKIRDPILRDVFDRYAAQMAAPVGN